MAQRILFVDDDEGIRKSFSIGLKMFYDYEVVTAENGEEGYKRFEEGLAQGGFAMVITDLQMPVLDGVGFARKIKENHESAGIPVYGITGWGMNSGLNDDCYNAGVREVIEKPLSLPQLAAFIRDHLTERHNENPENSENPTS